MGGFFQFLELHRKGSAPRARAATLLWDSQNNFARPPTLTAMTEEKEKYFYLVACIISSPNVY